VLTWPDYAVLIGSLILLGLLAWAFSLASGQMLWVVFKIAGVTFALCSGCSCWGS